MLGLMEQLNADQVKTKIFYGTQNPQAMIHTQLIKTPLAMGTGLLRHLQKALEHLYRTRKATVRKLILSWLRKYPVSGPSLGFPP